MIKETERCIIINGCTIMKDKFLEYIDNLGEFELRSLIYDIYRNYLTYEDVQVYCESDDL